MSHKKRRGSPPPGQSVNFPGWPRSGDGSLLDFVLQHSDADPHLVCRALVGDAPMPVAALMCGAPLARGSVSFDLMEWHGALMAELPGYYDTNFAILIASQEPTLSNLHAIRPQLVGSAADEMRLDFLLAVHGDEEASEAILKRFHGSRTVKEMFAVGLVRHAYSVSKHRKPYVYRSGIGLEILLNGIEIEFQNIEDAFKLGRSANAWRRWTMDGIQKASLDHRDGYIDGKVASDIALAQSVLDELARSDEEREAARQEAERDFMEGEFGGAREVTISGPGLPEGVLFDPKKVPKEALEALDILEHEADKQLPIDLSKPENVAFVLREKAALDERNLAKALVKTADALAEVAKVEEAVLPAPKAVTDVVVLEHFELPKNSSHSENDLLRNFSSFAGKPVSLLPAVEIEDLRLGLVDAYPHAAGIVDKLLSDWAPGKPIRMRPTLLVGSPGSGKTSLLNALCRAAWIPSLVYSCASVADGSFGGTASQWSTRRASIPLEAIRSNGIANPVIVLDEVEKTGHSERNGSLLNAILPFLEQHSSRSYFEPGLEKPVNLSWVSYLATANSLEGLPAPLKDRFRILQMPAPGPEHIGDLSRRIVSDLLKERQIDVRWVPPLAPDEIDIIKRAWAGGSLRRLRRAVEATLDARENALRGMAM